MDNKQYDIDLAEFARHIQKRSIPATESAAEIPVHLRQFFSSRHKVQDLLDHRIPIAINSGNWDDLESLFIIAGRMTERFGRKFAFTAIVRRLLDVSWSDFLIESATGLLKGEHWQRLKKACWLLPIRIELKHAAQLAEIFRVSLETPDLFELCQLLAERLLTVATHVPLSVILKGCEANVPIEDYHETNVRCIEMLGCLIEEGRTDVKSNVEHLKYYSRSQVNEIRDEAIEELQRLKIT